MSSAWPVPNATTRTSKPRAFLASGSRCLKSPDCSVDVVDATVMKPCASEREALLLAAGEHARGAVRGVAQAHAIDRLARSRLALRAANAVHRQGVAHVGERGAPQHHGALEHHRLFARPARRASPRDLA